MSSCILDGKSGIVLLVGSILLFLILGFTVNSEFFLAILVPVIFAMGMLGKPEYETNLNRDH